MMGDRTLSQQVEDVFNEAVDEAVSEAVDEAVKHEREACAKVADLRADTFSSNETPDFRDGEHLTAKEIAAIIRARTQDGK